MRLNTRASRCASRCACRCPRAAHPGNRFPYPLRTAYLAKTGQALFLVKFPERDVTETALWQVFSEMWALAARFGGGTSWN